MIQPKHTLQSGPYTTFVFELGSDKNHFYLVTRQGSKEALLIDAAFEVDRILEFAHAQNLIVKWVFLTHGHWDHVGSAQALQGDNRDFFIHQKDRDWLSFSVDAKSSSYRWNFLEGSEGSVSLWDGDHFAWVHTPGHTPGGCCLTLAGWLFTGDVLFIGRCGRADFRGGDPSALYRSLHQTIGALNAQLLVCSGHDYGEVPFRELAEEKKMNPYYLVGSETEFIQLRMGGRMNRPKSGQSRP